MPANRTRPRLLILGCSTRAAAWSAVRAGFFPVCADEFGDEDLRQVAEVLRKRRVEQPRPREEDEGEAVAPPEPEDWFSLADLLEPEDQTFPEVEITSLRLSDTAADLADLDDERPSDARAS